MERDDEQLIRHSSREIGEFLAIFYEELCSSGVPRKMAEKITILQWQQSTATTQAETIAKTISDAFRDQSMDGDA